MENQRRFLEQLAAQLHIRNPSDWGKVTKKSFQKYRGGGLLRHYKNSVFACIKSVYKGYNSRIFHLYFPDIEWKREWFQYIDTFSWKFMGERRKFLEEVAVKMNIMHPKDWGRVTTRHLLKLGGVGLLDHYNGSLFHALRSVYKGMNLAGTHFKISSGSESGSLIFQFPLGSL